MNERLKFWAAVCLTLVSVLCAVSAVCVVLDVVRSKTLDSTYLDFAIAALWVAATFLVIGFVLTLIANPPPKPKTPEEIFQIWQKYSGLISANVYHGILVVPSLRAGEHVICIKVDDEATGEKLRALFKSEIEGVPITYMVEDGATQD